MGQVSSSILDEAPSMTRDAVQLFQDVAIARQRAFELRLEKPSMDTSIRKLIPVQEELETTLIELVHVPEHADIVEEVRSVCSKYVAKDMFPVVAAAVSSDFFKLMLEEPGSAQMDNSLLTVGPEIGGLFRIDYLIYRYKPESQELAAQVDNMVFVIVVVHAVDALRINHQQALHAIVEMYGEVANPGMGQSLTDIYAGIRKYLPSRDVFANTV